MRISLRGLVGWLLLVSIGVASVAYPWWAARTQFVCPFGRDPAFPAQTVCDGTLGG